MITGLDHVDVIAADWEGTIEQYRRIFDTDRVIYADEVEGRPYRLARVEFGPGQSVNILQPKTETGPWANHLAKHGDGIYLMSLTVDDLDASANEMRARGVRFPAPIGGTRVIHPASAGGALILLAQRHASASTDASIRLDRVTLLVHDLDAVVQQYQAIFGTDEVEHFDVPGPYRMARFSFGRGQSIDIISPTTDTGPWAEHLAQHGDGIYLFALTVQDLEATIEGMRARGVRFPAPVNGKHLIHPASAGGARILLLAPGEQPVSSPGQQPA